MSSAIESLLSRIKLFADSADASARYKLSSQLHQPAQSVATPRQIMQQHGYCYAEQAILSGTEKLTGRPPPISLSNLVKHENLTGGGRLVNFSVLGRIIKIASDLDMFTTLAQSEHPLRLGDIVSRCGCDLALGDRILRRLAAIFTTSEVAESTFTPKEIIRLLAFPTRKGNVQFGFDTLNRAFQELPTFLKEHSYRNPDRLLNTAFHRAYDTNEPYFSWALSQPEVIRDFFPSLNAFKSPITWAQVIPLDEKFQDTDKDAPLFVDLCGGHGAQCAALRKAITGRFSDRVINQDLTKTPSEAPRYDDIKIMVQYFYKEQQVKGAKIYYIRHYLHDLLDENARRVLQRIRDAMSSQSLLFIDELIIPETGASRFAMQLDVTMMSMFSSTERTLRSWRKLLEEVGF